MSKLQQRITKSFRKCVHVTLGESLIINTRTKEFDVVDYIVPNWLDGEDLVNAITESLSVKDCRCVRINKIKHEKRTYKMSMQDFIVLAEELKDEKGEQDE